MAKHIKGLQKDTGQVDQPEGTYRYAKNAVLNDRVGSINNEHGTQEHSVIPAMGGEDTIPHIIGSIEITDDRIILFGVSDLRSSIYVVENGTTTAIFETDHGNVINQNDVDLKFSRNFPIEGTYRIDPDNDLIIYWTDNLNPPRSLNVTKQQSSPNTQLYSIDPETSPNKTYIDRLNLFPHAGPVPRITFKEITNGGALKSGIYYLFLAYVDDKATQTNYITSSLPVPIVEDVEGVFPIERFDGAPADSQTGKMITWNVGNLNTDYEYLRPVIVSRINNVELAYQLNDVEISNRETTVTFSMLEGYASAAVNDVIIDAAIYDKAKTIAQLDNILYLGNLEGSKDIGYQKYANFIKCHSVIQTWENFDPFSLNNDNLNNGFFDEDPNEESKTNGYRDTRNMIENRGYMRDEVYAFYIAFILNDGSMSYAYHIPGRPYFKDAKKANITNVGAVIPQNIGGDTVDEKVYIFNYDNTLGNMTSEIGQLFHFWDFSNQPVSVDTNLTKMNFWQNLNEFYPNTSDYEYWDAEVDIENNTTSGNSEFDLKLGNVRHHHFPSNNNWERSMIDHDLPNPSVVSSEGTETTHFFFTFDDVQDADGWWNGYRRLMNTNVNHYDQFPSELQDEFQGFVCPGCAFENASWQPPTDAILAQLGDVNLALWSMDDNDNWPIESQFSAQTGEMDGNHLIGNVWADAGLTDNEDVGFAMYSLQTPVVSTDAVISSNIRPLGFRLSDLKIPAEIANKVQGFRIYYAARDHNNRRILGQDHIKNASKVIDKDISACGSDGTGWGHSEDFLVPHGLLRKSGGDQTEKYMQFGSFHDFYLLNPGYVGETAVAKGLATATHVNRLHQQSFFCFSGPGHNYSNVDPEYASTSCSTINSKTAFHISHNTEIVTRNFNHIPLREKCRTYLNGDSIYDGRALGFGKRINNIGGERNIMLGVPEKRPVIIPDWWGGDATVEGWGDLNSPNTSAIYHPENKVRLDLFNLCAFKTDMYSSIDTQKLVWTGYEVLGDDLARFIVDNRPDIPVDGHIVPSDSHKRFETDHIYGGDTFICRHGYRMTSRPNYVGSMSYDEKSVLMTVCESTDNINLRHEEGNSSAYFPGAPLKRVLSEKATVDLTSLSNIKYNPDYSLGTRDSKFPPPLPLRDLSPTIFPNRVQRSASADNTSIIDNYRVFLAAQIKDLPRNRGELWKLVSFNNLLYMHLQDSLYRTKGKQSLQLSDATSAYLGSGDIFAQEPDELVQTESGYGGTQSQWAGIVTSFGYFCLDYRNRKIYMVTDKMAEISQIGMDKWFRDNIPFSLENYGIGAYDNPIAGIGFHAVWDEQYERILLTKRDLVPTSTFIDLYDTGTIAFDSAAGEYVTKIGPGGSTTFSIDWDDTTYFTKSGWTISYHAESNIWVSFHDYIPYLYTYDKQFMLSLQDEGNNAARRTIWEHSALTDPGYFYRIQYPFEFEFIFNQGKEDKVIYSFNYVADVYDSSNTAMHNQGFTSFYVYNSQQISGEQPLEYMMNIRRVGNEWKVNKFRDLARLINNTDTYYIGPHTGNNYGITGVNVGGAVTSEVVTTQDVNMFNIDGMAETINANFIDTMKSWNTQKKFIDKWVGIRLIYSNSTKNLIHLYATDVAAKKFYR